MADRWPRCMKRSTAAEYVDMGLTLFDQWVKEHRVPTVQPTERGDRRYLREDLDAALDTLSGQRVSPRAA